MARLKIAVRLSFMAFIAYGIIYRFSACGWSLLRTHPRLVTALASAPVKMAALIGQTAITIGEHGGR